jgi:hypothetical protein
MQCRCEDFKKFDREATYYEARKALILAGIVPEEKGRYYAR